MSDNHLVSTTVTLSWFSPWSTPTSFSEVRPVFAALTVRQIVGAPPECDHGVSLWAHCDQCPRRRPQERVDAEMELKKKRKKQ